MTEFDEYEYLEKSVDEHANGNGEAKSSKRAIDGDVPDGKSKRGRASEEDPRSSRRERERDRDLGNGKEHRHASRERDRGKERERDRPRERDRVDRERDRVGDRGDRGGGRGGDRDFDRGADRGGGRGDGYREKHREPYRERPVERPPRETKEQPLFEKERRDPRERRDNRKKEEEEVEVDPERDQRTVFAYQISLKADERDVYEFFSRAGKVRDVRLIMDRNSRRSKGVGYIEFYDVMSVPMAITLSGQPLMGQGVMVKPSEAEKNLVQPSATAAANAMTAATVGMMGFAGSGKRLYVGNLHVNMSEDALRQVFEPFGLVEQVQLPTNPESKECKGFGFVQYVRPDDARAAMTSLDGLELAGQKIKVSAVSDNVGVTEAVPENEKLDDEEGGGLTLNARSRAMLMAKLDRSGVPIPPVAAPTLAGMPGLLPGMPGALSSPVPMMMPLMPGGPGLGMPGGIPGLVAPGMVATMENPGLPTEYLLLKNMFDPTTETEPDFDEDIKDDVTEECSKFGQVKHIYVEKASAGHVYLRFDSVNAASAAQRALHGRWFAAKMITATFMSPVAYKTRFPYCGD